MSSILKALKKLEEDNAVRRPDELKLDAEILRSDNPPRFTSAGVILTSLLLLAGGSGATYLFMKNQVPDSAHTNQSVQGQQPVVPAAPENSTEQMPSAASIPAAHHKDADSLIPAQRQVPPPSRKLSAAAPSPVPRMTVRPVMTPPTAADIAHSPKSIQASTPAPAVKGIPTLRVNGIAFQNNNADSMAIVNGIPVSRGGTVEGITVEEIRNDRVLFQRNGEKFEIQLGQSNR